LLRVVFVFGALSGVGGPDGFIGLPAAVLGPDDWRAGLLVKSADKCFVFNDWPTYWFL
jgi:hypothetical protein